MKKLLLIAAVLVGAVSASQAAVHVDIGFGFPLPPPPIVISRPAPVYHPGRVHYPAPVVVAPCPPPRRVVCRPNYHYVGCGHYHAQPRYQHRQWSGYGRPGDRAYDRHHGYNGHRGRDGHYRR